MNGLHSLLTLLGQHHQAQQRPQHDQAPAVPQWAIEQEARNRQQQPRLQAHQAASPTLGNNTPQAQAYAANPRMLNVDPAQFGYPQENSPVQVNHPMPSYGMPNLGVSFHQIQGLQNPGFTPMQGSRGAGTNPQIRAFNSPYPQSFNPQDQQDGYVY